MSIDQGQHWFELGLNLPRVAVNDLLVHPRDNDLVLATHGRGIWILDNLASLQGLNPTVLASDAHLFPIEPAEMIRYSSTRGARRRHGFSRAESAGRARSSTTT